MPGSPEGPLRPVRLAPGSLPEGLDDDADARAYRVKGTAPKENYGGRVMCFLETGDGKATSLRFDYENPPVPPQPNRAWHLAKWLFNRMYWETVPQGRIPENAPFSKPKKDMTKEAAR